MPEFIPDEILEKSVREKNIGAIRTCLVNFIHFDPMFKTPDFKNALEYVESKNISIKVSYEKEIDEYKLQDPKDWNTQYFFLLTEWLRRNFAVKDRIPHIREVGRVAFKDRFQLAEESNKIEQTQKVTQNNKNLKKEQNSDFKKAPSDRRSHHKKKATIKPVILIIFLGVAIAVGVLIFTLIQN